MSKKEENNPLEPWIDTALEARVIALILGEASAFEEAELNQAMDDLPELKTFYLRMKATHKVLKEVKSVRVDPTKGPSQMSSEKRNAVLKQIRGLNLDDDLAYEGASTIGDEASSGQTESMEEPVKGMAKRNKTISLGIAVGLTSLVMIALSFWAIISLQDESIELVIADRAHKDAVIEKRSFQQSVRQKPSRPLSKPSSSISANKASTNSALSLDGIESTGFGEGFGEGFGAGGFGYAVDSGGFGEGQRKLKKTEVENSKSRGWFFRKAAAGEAPTREEENDESIFTAEAELSDKQIPAEDIVTKDSSRSDDPFGSTDIPGNGLAEPAPQLSKPGSVAERERAKFLRGRSSVAKKENNKEALEYRDTDKLALSKDAELGTLAEEISELEPLEREELKKISEVQESLEKKITGTSKNKVITEDSGKVFRSGSFHANNNPAVNNESRYQFFSSVNDAVDFKLGALLYDSDSGAGAYAGPNEEEGYLGGAIIGGAAFGGGVFENGAGRTVQGQDRPGPATGIQKGAGSKESDSLNFGGKSPSGPAQGQNSTLKRKKREILQALPADARQGKTSRSIQDKTQQVRDSERITVRADLPDQSGEQQQGQQNSILEGKSLRTRDRFKLNQEGTALTGTGIDSPVNSTRYQSTSGGLLLQRDGHARASRDSGRAQAERLNRAGLPSSGSLLGPPPQTNISSGKYKNLESGETPYYTKTPAQYKKPPQELTAPQPSKKIDLLQEKLVTEEPFSTFSLHVSDVSFKLAKASLLGKGEWPRSENIRPEEFVNAFDYGDPPASMQEKISCRLEQSTHPFLQQRNLLRVSIRTAAAGRAASRPLRLTILLDKSGSMERQDRERSVLRAMEALSSHLSDQDTVSLIGFARKPRLIGDRIPGNRSDELIRIVKQTPSEGGTNLEEALGLANQIAKRQFLENGMNRIVLITDGAANLGDADSDSLRESVIGMRQQGIAFDACGVGADGINDRILESLTRQGDGRYYFLDRPEDADSGFVRQLAGALRPAARNVKVQVKFNPDRVISYKLTGFEKHRLKKEDFRDDSVDAAEMTSAEAGVALYHFQADPGGSGDVGQVFVRFQEMVTGKMIEKSWTIPYERETERLEESDPSMQLAAVAGMFAEKLRSSPVGEAVDLGQLGSLISALQNSYKQSRAVSDLISMIEKARQLTQ